MRIFEIFGIFHFYKVSAFHFDRVIYALFFQIFFARVDYTVFYYYEWSIWFLLCKCPTQTWLFQTNFIWLNCSIVYWNKQILFNAMYCHRFQWFHIKWTHFNQISIDLRYCSLFVGVSILMFNLLIQIFICMQIIIIRHCTLYYTHTHNVRCQSKS